MRTLFVGIVKTRNKNFLSEAKPLILHYLAGKVTVNPLVPLRTISLFWFSFFPWITKPEEFSMLVIYPSPAKTVMLRQLPWEQIVLPSLLHRFKTSQQQQHSLGVSFGFFFFEINSCVCLGFSTWVWAGFLDQLLCMFTPRVSGWTSHFLDWE